MPHERQGKTAGGTGIVEKDIALAMQQRGIEADWTAASLALHTQAVIQGAFILAKATGSSSVASDCIDHLRRTIECLFNRPGSGDA